jgi:hypothetical protein
MGSNGLILRPNTGYDRFRRKKKVSEFIEIVIITNVFY